MTKWLGVRKRLLELYRLVVVVCVLENVSAKECLPIFLWTPNPSVGCDILLNPVTGPNRVARIGTSCPSLNPVLGTKSKSATTSGVISTLAPKPNDAPLVGRWNDCATSAGGKYSSGRGSK